MSTVSTRALIDAVLVLFTEAYVGPPDPRSTWFIDNEADSGVLGLLKQVSAVEASTPVNAGERGSTIASNVEHLRWSVANANNAFRGLPFNPNWSESWDLLKADEARWQELRHSLQEEVNRLKEILSQQEKLEDEYLLGVLAMLPHAAYHLGTIRQMIERVRAV